MSLATGLSPSCLNLLSSSSRAVAEMDVQRGGIREHEARKPVVLMFSPWSLDLASRQMSLISVFVDDYYGKWVVRHRSYLSFCLHTLARPCSKHIGRSDAVQHDRASLIF